MVYSRCLRETPIVSEGIYLRGADGPGFADLVGSAESIAEAHHRIANNLSVISSFVTLKAAEAASRTEPMSGQEASFLLQEAASRIELVGRLHRILSQAPADHAVDLGEHLRQTCKALMGSMFFGRRTQLAMDLDNGCRAPSEQVLPIALIVSEMLTNSIKYAHPSGVPGRLGVGCRRRFDGALAVTVSDDGVGFPEGFDPATNGGFGLRLVRQLTQQIGGENEFRSDDLGVTFTLVVPAPKRA
jgi:two-component sensor histidine kinase